MPGGVGYQAQTRHVNLWLCPSSSSDTRSGLAGPTMATSHHCVSRDAGQHPRRGPPGAECLPTQAGLRPCHFWGCLGGVLGVGGGCPDHSSRHPWATRAQQTLTPACPQVCLKYYEHEFVELACQCPAVVCCRCSPTQKAHIAKLLQQHTGKRTCAIGETLGVWGHYWRDLEGHVGNSGEGPGVSGIWAHI